MDALKRVTADCLAQHDPAGAANYLRAYVNLKPSEERGWCDLMNALVLSGERVGAIQLYEKCRNVFQSLYQIDPPPDMAELLHRIQREPVASALESPQEGSALNAPRGVVLLRSPFYIVRSTDQQFGDALGRRETIVLVKGPRQTGKTSLLARSLQRARSAGASIVLTDLQSLSEEHWQSTEAFCLALAQDLADQLDLPCSAHGRLEPRARTPPQPAALSVRPGIGALAGAASMGL